MLRNIYYGTEAAVWETGVKQPVAFCLMFIDDMLLWEDLLLRNKGS